MREFEQIAHRLTQGKGVTAVFDGLDSQTLVNIWPLSGKFVVTLEECAPGSQFDEASYLRDERHILGSVDEISDFLSAQNLSVDKFEPG